MPTRSVQWLLKREILDGIDGIGGLVGLLEMSDPALRSPFYEEVGLTGVFEPLTRAAEAAAALPWCA